MIDPNQNQADWERDFEQAMSEKESVPTLISGNQEDDTNNLMQDGFDPEYDTKPPGVATP